MKKQYTKPEADVSVFEAQDIITASIGQGETGNEDIGIFSPIHWDDEIN